MDRIEADLEEGVRVVKVPVALRDSWMPHAKLYYALMQMNKIDEMHNNKILRRFILRITI